MDGRFAKDGDVPVERETKAAAAAGALMGAPKPRYCRAFVRKRIAERMPEMVDLLMKQANEGSLGHLKILVQLAGLDKGEVRPPVKRREKSLEKILLEQWAQDDGVVAEDTAVEVDPPIADAR